MSQHVRIADGFMTRSAEQLVATAGTIVTGPTGNPAFPSRGPTATAEKYNKPEALIALLRRLKHYVEDNHGNYAAVVLSFRGSRISASFAISDLRLNPWDISPTASAPDDEGSYNRCGRGGRSPRHINIVVNWFGELKPAYLRESRERLLEVGIGIEHIGD